MYQLACTNQLLFYIDNIIFLFYKTSYLNEEVNCTEASLKIIFSDLRYHLIYFHSSKWHVDKMACWPNGTLTKWHVDKMTCWQNGILTKWHVDKMACWQNVMLTKWHVDKMASWQNGKLTKWLSTVFFLRHQCQVTVQGLRL